VDTATAIAIAAPNAVAATAIVGGWRQHSKALEAQRELAEAGFDNQRRLTDLDNVRTVLDDAAVMLHRDAYALDRVRFNLTTLGAGLLESKVGQEVFDELTAAGQGSDLLIERLAVRLGRDHAVVVALTSASEAALEAWRSVDRLRLAPSKDDPDERLQRHRFELGNKARDEVAEHRKLFDASREEFMDAAHRAAGAVVPGQADDPAGTVPPSPMADTAQRDRAAMLLPVLEGRRLATDNSMWQAPTLTLVAQAFLLGVLTDRNVGWAVGSAVAVAGVLALATAMLALWLLHDRERHFAERVKDQAVELGLGDPNRATERGKGHLLEWPGWLLWELVLFAFVVADVLALIVTRT
jgi:hypothetical protein